MAIQEGDFVKLHYTGTVDGRIFDTTDEEKAKSEDIYNAQALYGPVVIRVGSHHVIVGLDEALSGKEEGSEDEIDVPPEKAFGERDPDKVESFQKSSFKEKPAKGMTVKLEDKGEGVVVDIIGNRVIVDFNHPFAGKTLHYSYKIESKVEDLVEEVKGLIHLYAGRDMDVSFDGGTVTIILPPGINYDRRWVLWRSRIIHESFEYIPDINEITLVETFKRPEKKDEGEE
ncbi:MAG TPA: FKBP-type peptidyl-prolyl cis-trans isomerase [Methanoregulaceae archaeon]|nr:FKBP-type peptidyl-prolyl cis-trans isomerase [Methanoregulaceae archaeon]